MPIIWATTKLEYYKKNKSLNLKHLLLKTYLNVCFPSLHGLVDEKGKHPILIFNQYEWERKRGQADKGSSLSLLFLTRGASSCCHQIPCSVFENFPNLFFLYVLLPFTSFIIIMIIALLIICKKDDEHFLVNSK